MTPAMLYCFKCYEAHEDPMPDDIDVQCTAVGYKPMSNTTIICTLRAGHDGDHNWVVSDEKAARPTQPDEVKA